MIKLNNKNITYVALADSNNSTIGVKEIWYADSSNSVKLVYRRKDALIEGVDYEKYNLLNSYTDEGVTLPAQGADISVNPIPLDNKVLTIELGKISRNIFVNGKSPWFIPMWCMYDHNMYVMIVQERKGNDDIIHRMTCNWTTSNTITFDFINNVATLGNSTFQIEGTGYTFRGFNSAMWQNPRTVGRIKISDELHLVPCKLLKPVPKWLDANGIRRQVGECGMIDLVSGKFFGNVNSVGTFTVENYYERKEWLVGDGSAYIDTDIIVDVPSLYISTSFTKKVNVEITSPLFGSRDIINSNGSQIFYQNGKLRFDIITNGANWIIVDSSDIQNINQLIVDCPNKVININEITLSSGVDDLSIKNSSNTFKIYSLELLNASYGNSVPYNGAFGNFTLNDSTHSLNLIPCTLTMDLPASMDANNIARTKGTSGMWDLVSDRFYGNVANSGTFKAVNLAEGVDYEVHDWLVGDGRAYIDTLIYDLTGKSIYCKLERNTEITDWGNTRILGREGNSRFVVSFTNNSYTTNITLWTQNRSYAPLFTTTEGWIRINLEDNLVETHQSSESIETYTIESSNLSIILFGDRFSTTTVSGIYKGKIGQLTVNQSMNLIPVKLLRSIPSKYDANGIARQAGECGMYDTVNDNFYGNVASSGSFTVSDDS